MSTNRDLPVAPTHSAVFDQFELVSLSSLCDVVKSLKPTNCLLDIVPAKVLKMVFNTVETYGDLLLYSEVWWLNRGKVLQRFVDLLPEIKTFLETRKEEHEELSDDQWLLDLGFLTDLTAKLNALNNELQGKDRHLPHMITVNAFKAKLGVWNRQLKNGRLTHFPNLEKKSQAIGDKNAFHPEQYCVHLDKVAEVQSAFW